MKNRIILFVLFSALMVSTIAFSGLKRRSSTSTQDWFWANKVHAPERYDVLAFGDSRIYRGFVPDIFASCTGRTAFNFGFSGVGIEREILRSCRSRVNPNGLIIIGLSPYMLTNKAANNSNFRNVNGLSTFTKNERLYLGRFMVLLDPFTYGDLTDMLRGNRKGTFEHFREDGWVATSRQSMDSSRSNDLYRKVFQGNEIQTERVQLLLETIANWRRDGIAVVVTRPIVADQLRSIEDSSCSVAYDLAKKKLIEAGAVWIDVSASGIRSYDGNHLDSAGACLWTQRLCDSLLGKNMISRRTNDRTNFAP